jgi:hypothetical protein
MRPNDARDERVDGLYREILACGEDMGRLRSAVPDELEELTLLALVRRSVPARFLELAARHPVATERPRILAAIVLNPRAGRHLSLRLLPFLYWRDLADVSVALRVPGPVRLASETLLKEKLPDMKSGEKIALGKVASPALLVLLLQDPDPRILLSCLQNPRLREDDLVRVLRLPTVPVHLIEELSRSHRWGESYPVRLEVVLQPRTPLPIALSFLSGLARGDLLRVAEARGLAPLLGIAAARLRDGGTRDETG